MRPSPSSSEGFLIQRQEGLWQRSRKRSKEGYVLVEWITPERFEKAKKLRLRYQDKTKISFTDLTSMVLMKEHSIEGIITEDEHFQHVGMSFQLKP
jgi:predicted nucleic acid-binding protein